MLKKRRYSDIESLNTETNNVDWDLCDWDLCIFCQENINEKLECPADLKPKGYDPSRTYQNITKNINRFYELDAMPINSFILPKEKCTADLFFDMKVKFHKLCKNRFSDMKIQRLEKKIYSTAVDPQVEEAQNIDCEMTSAETAIDNVTRTSNSPSSSKGEGETRWEMCF